MITPMPPQFDPIAVGNDVLRGTHFDIVGAPGAGRSTALRRTGDAVTRHNRDVVLVRGYPAFRSTQFGALALAGLATFSEARPHSFAATLAHTATEVASRLSSDVAAILVGDWDDMDDASWGVLQVVSERSGTAIVRTLLRGNTAALSAAARSVTAAVSTREISLSALSFSELEQVLQRRLGAPISGEVLSRTFAKSGGNPGVAIALVETARQTGRLDLRRGVWHGGASLWTPELAPVIRAFTGRLSPPEHELLETLALTNSMGDLTVATSEAFAGLQARGYVALLGAEGAQLTEFNPPILVEYFRDQAAGHSRLTHTDSGAGSLTAVASDTLNDLAPRAIAGEDLSPQHVRTAHERIRSAQAAAVKLWRSERTLTSAATALRQLLLTPERAQYEIETIIGSAAEITGSAEERATWALAHSEAAVTLTGDIERAVSLLLLSASKSDPFEPALQARAARLALLYRHDLSPARKLVPPTSEIPQLASLELASTQALLALVAGDPVTSLALVADARTHLSDSTRESDTTLDIVEGYSRYLTGDPGAAIKSASERFDRAVTALDVPAAAGVGALCATLCLLEGRHAEASAMLDQVAALGSPAAAPGFTGLSVSITSAVLAARRGQSTVAMQRKQETQGSHLPNVPLPGVDRQWIAIQNLASAGKREQAAELAFTEADAFWARGARLIAGYAYLAGLELELTHERLLHAAPRIKEIRASTLHALLALVEARASGDIDRLSELADDLVSHHRYSFAASTMHHAARLAGDHWTSTATKRLTERAEQLSELAVLHRHDPNRGTRAVAKLTARERKIARLAESGLSNQQIAAELVLSVRTVESHVYRLMKKLGVDRRTELGQHVSREPGSLD